MGCASSSECHISPAPSSKSCSSLGSSRIECQCSSKLSGSGKKPIPLPHCHRHQHSRSSLAIDQMTHDNCDMTVTEIRPTTTITPTPNACPSSGLDSNSNQYPQFPTQYKPSSNHDPAARFQANPASHHKTRSNGGNFKLQQVQPKLKTNFSEPNIQVDLNYGNIDQGPFFDQLSVARSSFGK